MISSLPTELSGLYEGFLANIEDSEKPQSLKLFQWIRYAFRPLSLSELRFAMAVDEDTTCLSIQECRESELYVETDEDMEKRVCDLSQGLAESTESDGKRVVQLIHQSVDDFLLEKGLQILHQSQSRALNGTLPGCSHFRLSRSCIKYLSMGEIQDYVSNKFEKADPIAFSQGQREALTFDFSSLFPFIEYATKRWVDHAQLVERENIPQADLISYFHLNSKSPSDLFSSWIHICQMYFDEWRHMEYFPLGSTLFHIASERGLLSVLKEASSQGIKLDPVDENGRTPLSWAASNGQEAVAKLLLEREGVMADCKDNNGRTSLSWAASNGQEAVAKLLLEREGVMADCKDNNGRTPFFWAASNEQEAVVKLLLERKDVDVNSKNNYGNTPLSEAANNGHETVMKLLLQRDDVDVNSKDNDGFTSLSLAALTGHEAVVKLLLERENVNADSKNNNGNTPLSLAAMNGREKVMKLLLERNDVDANSKNNYGDTSLSWTALNEHGAMMKLLFERNDVDVNSKNNDGDTPLSEAIKSGNEMIMKLLLERDDVDANSKNNEGDTPLSLAAGNGQKAVMKLLLERNDVRADCRNNNSEAPLFRAVKVAPSKYYSSTAWYRFEAVVTLLLERDEVKADQNDIRKALSFAERQGYENTANLLRQHFSEPDEEN